MSYLTYEEYIEYGGHLDNVSFSRLEYRAEVYVDKVSFGKLRKETKIPEAVKRLIFELVHLINTSADISKEDYTPTISSEGNDGYSISYNAGSIVGVEMAQKQIASMIEDYLANVRTESGEPLLYCGLNGNR